MLMMRDQHDSVPRSKSQQRGTESEIEKQKNACIAITDMIMIWRAAAS
jgi:hypothetical protein